MREPIEQKRHTQSNVQERRVIASLLLVHR